MLANDITEKEALSIHLALVIISEREGADKLQVGIRCLI